LRAGDDSVGIGHVVVEYGDGRALIKPRPVRLGKGDQSGAAGNDGKDPASRGRICAKRFSTVAAGNEYCVARELHDLASSSEGGKSIREAIAEHRSPLFDWAVVASS